jgi:hypothetical protein
MPMPPENPNLHKVHFHQRDLFSLATFVARRDLLKIKALPDLFSLAIKKYFNLFFFF